MTLDIIKEGQARYIRSLQSQEKQANTIRKHSLAIRTFIKYAEEIGRYTEISKDCLIEYKDHLTEKYMPNTCNLYIQALNNYLRFLGEGDLRVKALRIQSQNVSENCFTHDEYKKMLTVAKKLKDDTAYYLIRTLANTGMRIAGIAYITVAAAKKGHFIVTNKGKTRIVVIPEDVCVELLEYCKVRGITEGYVFKGQKPKKPISQSSIRRWIKKTAELAAVDKNKAFPHNLRHLFAVTYLDTYGNLSELSDLLGHTRIETTRIYTRTGIAEKRKKIAKLGL